MTYLLSLASVSDSQTRVRVNFTGDFSRENGLQETAVDDGGLIARIYADLE